jgi:hypothetical protein
VSISGDVSSNVSGAVTAHGSVSPGSSGVSIKPLIIGGVDGVGVVRTIGTTSGNVIFTTTNASSTDDVSNAQGAQPQGGGTVQNGQWEVRPFLFDGSNWDRERSNLNVTLLASSSRSASTSSAEQTNNNANGVWVVLNITAVPGADTITLKIQGKDPTSGTYVDLLTGSAQSGIGTTEYALYPGVTETANVDVGRPLPRTWLVTVTHSGSGAFTYSVGASVIR